MLPTGLAGQPDWRERVQADRGAKRIVLNRGWGGRLSCKDASFARRHFRTQWGRGQTPAHCFQGGAGGWGIRGAGLGLPLGPGKRRTLPESFCAGIFGLDRPASGVAVRRGGRRVWRVVGAPVRTARGGQRDSAPEGHFAARGRAGMETHALGEVCRRCQRNRRWVRAWPRRADGADGRRRGPFDFRTFSRAGGGGRATRTHQCRGRRGPGRGLQCAVVGARFRARGIARKFHPGDVRGGVPRLGLGRCGQPAADRGTAGVSFRGHVRAEA